MKLLLFFFLTWYKFQNSKLKRFCVQVGLTGSQVWWATDVGIAFERVEEGFETALKEYNKKQVVIKF